MTPTLRNKTIVNTRASHQAQSLDDLIRSYSARPLAYPCISIQPPDDTTQLDVNLQQLADGGFNWLVITSTNTVLSLAQRLQALELTLSASFQVAAIGPSTAQAVKEQLGLTVNVIPDEHIAESLAAAIPAADSLRIFLPESAIARPTLADELTKGGHAVQTITAYQTVRGSGGVDLPALLHQQQVDIITFTSSSTVTNFLERLHEEGQISVDHPVLQNLCIACIGPKAARTAEEAGLPVAVIPDDYTLEGLLTALEHHFSKQVIGN